MKIENEIADFLQRRRLFKLCPKRKKDNHQRRESYFYEEGNYDLFCSDLSFRICRSIIELLSVKKPLEKVQGFIDYNLCNDLLSTFFSNSLNVVDKPYKIVIQRRLPNGQVDHIRLVGSDLTLEWIIDRTVETDREVEDQVVIPILEDDPDLILEVTKAGRVIVEVNQEIEEVNHVIEEVLQMTEEVNQEDEVLLMTRNRKKTSIVGAMLTIVLRQVKKFQLQQKQDLQKSPKDPNLQAQIKMDQKKKPYQLGNHGLAETELIKNCYKWLIPMTNHVKTFLSLVGNIESDYQNNCYRWISSVMFQNCKFEKTLLFDVCPLVVNSKYNWDDDTVYVCQHSTKAKNQRYPMVFSLIEDGNECTKREEYNNIDNWTDKKLYQEVFSVEIEPILKSKLIIWIESAGGDPSMVKFKGRGKSEFQLPKNITYNEFVVAIEFYDIVLAIVFQLLNTARILPEQSKFIYWQMEWALFIYLKTRKNLHGHCSICLPDLAEFEEMLQKCRALFPNGCGPSEPVCAPGKFGSRSFEYELDDLQREHTYTYNHDTGSSSIVDGASFHHKFQYCDLDRSVNNMVSPYRSDRKAFGPTPSQLRKRDFLADKHKWARELPHAFEGEYMAFNKMGMTFQMPTEPLIHECDPKKCRRNCFKKGKVDYFAIPLWSMSFYASKSTKKYSLTPEDNAKLFRSFKIVYMKKIMMITVNV